MMDLQKIHEISQGVDEHLRKLEAFTGLLREIKNSLEELRHAQERSYLFELQRLRQDFGDVVGQLKKHGLQESSRYEKDLRDIRECLESAAWPEAVEPSCVCDSDEKAVLRAEGILDLLVGENLRGKKFLDFGCGEGHTVPQAIRREAAFALGYDLDLSKLKFPPEDYTDDFGRVRSAGRFDVILLHDVLDHVVVSDPVEVLVMAKSVLSPGGRIYVRNHPWSSRHGGHLYLKKNKAFLHLALDPVELSRVGGLQCEHNIRVVKPLATYKHWFESAGLRVFSEVAIRNPVEPVFLTPSALHDRLIKHWDSPADMEADMEVSFAEYVLECDPSTQQIF